MDKENQTEHSDSNTSNLEELLAKDALSGKELVRLLENKEREQEYLQTSFDPARLVQLIFTDATFCDYDEYTAALSQILRDGQSRNSILYMHLQSKWNNSRPE